MISQAQLDQVKEYSGLFFTLEEISLLTGIDLEEFRREVNFGFSELNNAYWMGKLSSQIALRQATLGFAKAGSPQAEEQMMEWLMKQKQSENG